MPTCTSDLSLVPALADDSWDELARGPHPLGSLFHLFPLCFFWTAAPGFALNQGLQDTFQGQQAVSLSIYRGLCAVKVSQG